MKIEVFVKTSSKHEKIEKINASTYKVSVNAPAQEGKANAAVTALLAEHFGISKSAINLLHGHKAKKKLFEIIGSD